MSNNSEIQKDLSNDRQILLKKLSTIFDSQTAIDFVSPKAFKARRNLTIEDLENVNSELPEKYFQRLRSMEHYQTITQSLSRLDLETSYQAFIREQIARNPNSRNELERYVRNQSDIDGVNYYQNSSHAVSAYPLKSRLLFYSSKLNEEKANFIKSATPQKTLRQLHEGFHLRQYFPEQFMTPPRSALKPRETFHVKRTSSSARPRTMHVEQGEKKYRITFLRDSKTLQKSLDRSTNHRNLEALFDGDNSTVSNTSNITFPPLSLAALKEYRPILTSTIDSGKQRSKSDFIWEQSIVSSKYE